MQKEFKIYLAEVNARATEAGSTVPAQRAAFKNGFSFSAKPFEAQLPIWNYVWKQSTGFWQRLHAFLFLERFVGKKEYHKEIWVTSVLWQEDVADWALCDSLAKLNTKVLETYPDEVYSQLVAWNSSDDLWKRRQSVVSLLYFSRTKKGFLPFNKIFALIEPLLTDKEYYVQKGVGWALRELHTVYPTAIMPFLQKHIKQVSAIAFTIAIEKMGAGEKDALKAIRKG
jgi:3-methyladenine DNA glycosylase AlkD